MPLFDYDQALLQQLRDAPFDRQGAVGDPPASWAEEMGLDVEYDLPDESLTRSRAREICYSEEHDILYGYLCAMAWGAQGRGPAGARPVKAAWNQRQAIKERIDQILEGRLSRADAYDHFSGASQIDGLGPAYFTKLLYFFCPAEEPNCYIMDQWTTKPVILLTGKNIIRHTGHGPTSLNEGSNYELFCRVIDDLSEILNDETPEFTEERLFSVGSIRRGPRGVWRQVVVDQWKNRRRLPRYNRSEVESLLRKGVEGDGGRPHIHE